MDYSKIFALSILLTVTTNTFSQSNIAVGSYTNSRDDTYHLFSYTTTDGGNTWSSSVMPPPLENKLGHTINHVTCDKSGKQCVAVGNKKIKPNNSDPYFSLSYFSADNGATWSSSNITPPANAFNSYLSSVTCNSTAKNCVAVGSATLPCETSHRCIYPLIYTTSDAGKNWDLSNTPSLPYHVLHSVACAENGNNCVAVGGSQVPGDPNRQESPVAYISNDGGKTWIENAMPIIPSYDWSSYYIDSISCNDTGVNCVAVGQIFKAQDDIFPISYFSTDGGKNWKISKSLPGEEIGVVKKLNSVTCDVTGNKCVSVGSAAKVDGFKFRTYPLAFVTLDAGRHWKISKIIPSSNKYFYELQSVSCDEQNQQCIAMGEQLNLTVAQSELITFISTDGGTTWTTPEQKPALKVYSENLSVSVS